MTETYLIVGLGNPGREYRENRHNIGFMLIDRLALRLDAKMSRLQSKALIASTRYGDAKIILAKPQTFMNLSGQAVQGLLRFYKLPLENLVIAHDDLDLPFETIRLRPGGGAGGQKGIKSTIQHLNKRFPSPAPGYWASTGAYGPSRLRFTKFRKRRSANSLRDP